VPGGTQLRIPFATLIKVGFAVLLGAVIVKAWPLILMVFVAVIIAVTLDPLVVLMERHRIARPFGALAVAVLIVVVVGLLAGFVGPVMVHQVAAMVRRLPSIVQRITAIIPAAGPFLEHVLSEWQRRQTAAAGAGGRAVVEGVTAVVLVYVIAIYLLVEGRRVYAWLVDFVPARNRRRVDRTCAEVSEVVRSYLRGSTIAATVCGSYVLVVLTVLHIPLAIVLAVLAFLFDFIPVVGTIIMAMLATVVALLVSPARALIVAGAYLLYHGIEAYVLVPRIYGRRMRLSTLTVILAMTTGAVLQGVIGAVVALPIAAAYPIVERIWLRERLPPDTVELHEELEETRS
jgi:predicted PurR-regulated permease PerM